MKGKKLTAKERQDKLESDEQFRRVVFKDLCAHLAKGHSIDCFSALSENTIRSYINLYPKEFVGVEIEQALRDGKEMWESLGTRQANGSCLGNSRTWFYNMAHRYKWSDRVEVQNEHKGQVAVNIVSYASTKLPVQHSESEQTT